jgi:hypothetical protein
VAAPKSIVLSKELELDSERLERMEEKMKKLLIAAIGLIFLGLLVPGAAFAQGSTTGDRELDSLLGTINLQEKGDPEGFIPHLSRSYNVPEVEIRQARIRYELSAGDTFMATVLSGIFDKPVGYVAEEYMQNQGQGWGVMAMNRGIKPGSLEFKQMKAKARGSMKYMETMAQARKNRQNHEMKIERENAWKIKNNSQVKGHGNSNKK